MDLIEIYAYPAENPVWEEFDKEWKHVYDWRTYIPYEIRELWDTLDLETRCMLVCVTEQVADREHWS